MNAVQVEMAEQEATFAAPAGALREQAAERLAAHRERRMRVAARQAQAVAVVPGPRAVAPSGVPSGSHSGAHAGARSERIAAAVAERYAQTQSYRAFLAAEAESSVRLAQAAAEVAARNAEAIAAARRVLLVELEEMARAEAPAKLEVVPPSAPVAAVALVHVEPAEVEEDLQAEAPAARSTEGGLTVRLYEDAGRSAREAAQQAAALAQRSVEALTPERAEATESLTEDERRMLDEEIAYRHSPTDELERTSVAIPGNLLEFPRQLVAARKARPRYAEGPLREDADTPDSQLRIFEVEAVQTEAPVESAAPEWSSIWLDALTHAAPEQTSEEAQYVLAQRPETASISLRLMAAMVDGCLIGAAYVLFATVFAYETEALPGPMMAVIGSVILLGSLYLMYQMLFFTLAEATPGMRYARIGLCTLTDENPTRAAMRMRVPAVLLAACPLGLGLLWACLDDDRLGWHDRISRMYQREY